MNIRKKLILGLAAISLLVGAVGTFAIVTDRDVHRSVTDLSRFRRTQRELNADEHRFAVESESHSGANGGEPAWAS